MLESILIVAIGGVVLVTSSIVLGLVDLVIGVMDDGVKLIPNTTR